MPREQLSSFLLSPDASKLAVIDVRDDDYVGGHINSSIHVPSSSLDYRIPEIVRTMADKEIVVFHCALSQQRGPTAALRYLKERDLPNREPKGQEVYVLDKGFVGWQEKYGNDERLTEGYVADIWTNYY
ncbi:Rhodanese-like domain-containing protein [Usnea florida]